MMLWPGATRVMIGGPAKLKAERQLYALTGWFKITRIRTGTGRRVFRMAPLHHHFELSGWAETKVVTRFWLLGGLFAIVGLSTLKLQ